MNHSPWILAPSLVALLEQVNHAYPKRSREWDGSIGDTAHAARVSDHNPNERGIVCAIDITHDQASGCDAGTIAERLRHSRDPRIAYVIFDRRIFSSTVKPWVWRPYNGTNPHDHHVHISVYDDERPWVTT